MKDLLKALELYLVTDRAACRGRSLTEVVRAALAGGVSMVQLREKTLSTRDFIGIARQILTILAPYNVPLIINDRVEVALEVQAHGVHLGQNDMSVAQAREILGPSTIIGLSVEYPSQLAEAQCSTADYLAIGPVFPTETKPDAAPPWGAGRLRRACKNLRKPTVAIGGIDLERVRAVLQCGVQGVAMVSAICSSADPKATAREIKKIFREAC